MRATSSIAQALASGYRRVLCCSEIEEARRLRAELGDEAITGGERDARVIEGFDAGASPREFLQPRAETLILSTTNGTRAVVAAAAACDDGGLGSLLNLAPAARAWGGPARPRRGVQGRVRDRRRVLRGPDRGAARGRPQRRGRRRRGD